MVDWIGKAKLPYFIVPPMVQLWLYLGIMRLILRIMEQFNPPIPNILTSSKFMTLFSGDSIIDSLMKCVILHPSSIHWRGYFHQIQKVDIFVFYDDVRYEKHGWRNRNRIKTNQGTKWLTIPVYKQRAHVSHIPETRWEYSPAGQTMNINNCSLKNFSTC